MEGVRLYFADRIVYVAFRDDCGIQRVLPILFLLIHLLAGAKSKLKPCLYDEQISDRMIDSHRAQYSRLSQRDAAWGGAASCRGVKNDLMCVYARESLLSPSQQSA